MVGDECIIYLHSTLIKYKVWSLFSSSSAIPIYIPLWLNIKIESDILKASLLINLHSTLIKYKGFLELDDWQILLYLHSTLIKYKVL